MQSQPTPEPASFYVGFWGEDVDPSDDGAVYVLDDEWLCGPVAGTRIDPCTGRVFYSARWL